METFLGVIGGSGLYDVPGLAKSPRTRVPTPWGEPSDELLIGELSGRPIAFLPRHGRGHKCSAGGINYRANIDALKRIAVTDIVSISACGSLKEELSPDRFVPVDHLQEQQ